MFPFSIFTRFLRRCKGGSKWRPWLILLQDLPPISNSPKTYKMQQTNNKTNEQPQKQNKADKVKP